MAAVLPASEGGPTRGLPRINGGPIDPLRRPIPERICCANANAAVDLRLLARVLQDVRWADFGFEGRDGGESTLWIGSEGANTPCHQDAYGYNLVLQVQGR